MKKNKVNTEQTEEVGIKPVEQNTKRGVPRYDKNPFIANALANTSQGVRRIAGTSKDRMMIVSENTGEIVAGAGFWQFAEVDKTQFVKLYIDGVKAFKGLSGAGTKVFEVLYMRVQAGIGKDEIWMNYSSIDQNITPMASSTYYKGMKELLEKKFIAESTVLGKYYLNPDYMWNGDRLAFVKEYALKGAKPNDQAMRERLEEQGQMRIEGE